MAHPFGDQDQSPGGAAKRPAQTIEGTATEVTVEPHEKAHAEPKEEPSDMHVLPRRQTTAKRHRLRPRAPAG